VAFLPFENLTGDASLDWVKLAAARVAAAQLTGVAGTIPILANTLRDAQLASATHYVHGYFDLRRGAALHFEAVFEDAASRKAVRTLSSEADLLGAGDAVAKTVDPEAQPFSTADRAAAEAWGKGDFERAVALDPDFGHAWLAWTQALAAAKETARAIDVASRALARATLRSPVSRAQIELASATLRQDETGRAAALTKLSRLVANDSTVIQALAELELRARRFDEAARLYREMIRLEPTNAGAMNLLGYAYALAGNVPSAQEAFEEYGRQPGHEANALDSSGDAYFLNGQFSQAEKRFLEAHAKQPGLMSGSDLAKAAYARWLAGDLSGADGIFQRYLDFRTRGNDPLVAWRHATWLYATGRPGPAIERLAGVSGPTAELARKQLEVWRNPQAVLPSDMPALKRALDSAPVGGSSLPRVLYAEGLLKEGREEEARKLLREWPLPESQVDPLFQSLVFPKYLELKGRLR
jgi:Flp pilus assembly protein TadD